MSKGNKPQKDDKKKMKASKKELKVASNPGTPGLSAYGQG
jgi:hypothetical protein